MLDLDPGAGAGIELCVEVAHLCREVLDAVGFASVPVTSGSKGIHLYAAMDGAMTSDEASGWAPGTRPIPGGRCVRNWWSAT